MVTHRVWIPAVMVMVLFIRSIALSVTEGLTHTNMYCRLRAVVCYRNWYQDWGNCGVTNDLRCFPGRWWHHNDRNRGSVFYFIMMPQSILNLCRFGVYNKKIAHKTASNQPLRKAWPQTIVTAASLVASWLQSWCHSDACVIKSWQYASMKN